MLFTEFNNKYWCRIKY